MTEVSDLEWLQMKLIYAALYVSLDLIELHHVVNVNWYTRRRKDDLKAPTTVCSDDYAGDVSLTSASVRSLQGMSGKVSLSKRFVELKKLVKTFKKSLGHISKTQAVIVWRWLCRQSSDLIVLRYIRQNKASEDVIRAIATTIRMQATSILGPQELYRGEQFYINVKPDPVYINRWEIGRITIIGANKQNQPIILVRSAVETAHESRKHAMRRAAQVVCELAYMCQDEGTNGCTILFDMSGYSLKHVDRHFAAYLGELQNIAFPGLCAKIYMWDAPKSFRTLWGAVKHFYSPDVHEIRTFTRDPKVLLETIDADQLPPELGGTAKDAGKWIPPRETDDLPIKDLQTRQKLLEKREALLDKFQALTCGWLAGESNMDERKAVLEQCKRNYFELDPYVRRRTMFDRNGVMGRCRPEFAPGGLAQPVCGIDLKPTRAKLVTINNDGTTAPSSPSLTSAGPRDSSVESIRYHSLSSLPETRIRQDREAELAVRRESETGTTPSSSDTQHYGSNSPAMESLTSLSTADGKRSQSSKSPSPSPLVASSPERPTEAASLEPATPKSTMEDQQNLGLEAKQSMGFDDFNVGPKSRAIDASLERRASSTRESCKSPPRPAQAPSLAPFIPASSTASSPSDLRIQTSRAGILKSPGNSPIDARIKCPLSEGIRSSRSPSTSPTDLARTKSAARAKRTSIILMKPLPSVDPEQLAKDRASVSPASTASLKRKSGKVTDVDSTSSGPQKSVAWDIPATVVDT